MSSTNRLVLDPEQEPVLRSEGDKITSAGCAGNFGFSTVEASQEVVELRHAQDVGSEPIYITHGLFVQIAKAFGVQSMNYAAPIVSQEELTKATESDPEACGCASCVSMASLNG